MPKTSAPKVGYVDGFVLVVPIKHLPAYKKMATVGARTWMKHGALDYKECVADDMTTDPACGLPFPKLTQLKKDEIVVFSFITYKSKAHRNSVNKKVMKDPAMNEACDPNNMPFDPTRMAYGGFKTLVSG